MTGDKYQMKSYTFQVKSYWPLAKRLCEAAFRNFSLFTFHVQPVRAEARGFTLIEMIVALGIFSVVMLIAFGVAISLQTAQFKATRIQIVQDDLRFALESMSKEMRTGTTFQGLLPITGVPNGYGMITFRRSDGVSIMYCAGSKIRRSTDGTTSCSGPTTQPVTGGDVTIESLTFYLIGATTGAADGQPRITISLKARSKDSRLVSSFSIQTTVSQRLRDL